jgi:hypothetical protein
MNLTLNVKSQAQADKYFICNNKLLIIFLMNLCLNALRKPLCKLSKSFCEKIKIKRFDKNYTISSTAVKKEFRIFNQNMKMFKINDGKDHALIDKVRMYYEELFTQISKTNLNL